MRFAALHLLRPTGSLMAIIQFRGYAVPPGIDINFAQVMEWLDDDAPDYRMRFVIHPIANSQILVECEVDRYERQDHLARIAMRAIDSVHAVLDVLGFAKGISVHVVVNSFSELGGEAIPFRPGEPHLAALCTAFASNTSDFLKILEIVGRKKNLIRAFRDLSEALSAPVKIVPHCAKAVDTIRNLIAPGLRAQDQWLIVHANLRVTQQYLQRITDELRGPRHGDHKTISGTITEEVSRRTWIVMNRYLEYLKLGEIPLPLDKFPVLT